MPVDEPWNMKPPRPHVEPSARWIRARVGETLLADSRRAMLLAWYGPGRLPTYALPAEDVRTDRFPNRACMAPQPPTEPGTEALSGPFRGMPAA